MRPQLFAISGVHLDSRICSTKLPHLPKKNAASILLDLAFGKNLIFEGRLRIDRTIQTIGTSDSQWECLYFYRF